MCIHFIDIFSDINECESNPCSNGGVCVDGINGYACNCTDGYIGPECDIGEFF